MNSKEPIIEKLRPQVILYLITVFGDLLDEQGQIGGEHFDISRIVGFDPVNNLVVALGLLADKIEYQAAYDWSFVFVFSDFE